MYISYHAYVVILRVSIGYQTEYAKETPRRRRDAQSTFTVLSAPNCTLQQSYSSKKRHFYQEEDDEYSDEYDGEC